MLLIMLIFLATFIIAMSAAAPRLAQQVKRDRETEMIHRGEQYARAIKRFVKKTGQYPTSIEQLEKTNNIRFLRKRYKDPLTPDGEWKLVRYGELQLMQAGLGSSGTQGNEATGKDDKTTDSGPLSPPTPAPNPANRPGLGGPVPASAGGGNSIFGGGQQFGGGPIIGVASKSEKAGIHEFNNKRKYNQWLFVYDQQQDQAAAAAFGSCIPLIKGPYNPKKNLGRQNPIGIPAGDLNKQNPPPFGGGDRQLQPNPQSPFPNR